MKRSRILLFIAAASIIVNVGCAVVGHYCAGRPERDAATYYSFAQQILEQGFFVPDPSKLRNDIVGPGYPWIVAVSLLLSGGRLMGPFIVNALALSLLALVVHALGTTLDSPRTGLMGMFWQVIYLPHIMFIPMVRKEVWLCLVFTLSIYLLLKELRSSSLHWRTACLPLVFVFLLHIDERFLVFAALFPLVLLLCGASDRRLRLKKMAVFLVVLMIGLVPWQVRNYVVYGRPMLLTSRTDSIISHFLPGEGIPTTSVRSIEKCWVLTEEQIQEIADGASTHGRNPAEVEQIRNGDVPHRFSLPERWWASFNELWRPCKFRGAYMANGFRYQIWSLRHNLISLALYGSLLPFFLYGLITLVKRKRVEGYVLGIIVCTYTAIHVFFLWSITRYRLPLDSLVIVLAMLGLCDLAGKLRHHEGELHNRRLS